MIVLRQNLVLILHLFLFVKMGIKKGLTHAPEEMKELKEITLNQKFITNQGNEKKIDNYHIYKGFRSFKPNKLLGEYLRKRMNIKSGKPFTESDFKKYGRDTIDLTLLGEGQYFADFSVKNKSS